MPLNMEDSYFWKNIVLSILFFTLTPIALGLSLFTLITLSDGEKADQAALTTTAVAYEETLPTGASVFAAIPAVTPSVDGEIGVADARPELIRQYLARYNSPIEHLSQFIVDAADKYAVDFRLITAIGQQESNLCKRIPEGTYNCWGWGIHSRGTLGFRSYEEGIETVTAGLKAKYIDQGLTNPDEIMKKYTPSSPEGAWAKGVNSFMSDME
jgi:hypothetical protein